MTARERPESIQKIRRLPGLYLGHGIPVLEVCIACRGRVRVLADLPRVEADALRDLACVAADLIIVSVRQVGIASSKQVGLRNSRVSQLT